MIKFAMFCSLIANLAKENANLAFIRESNTVLENVASDLNTDFGFLVSKDNSWMNYIDHSLPNESPREFFARYNGV